MNQFKFMNKAYRAFFLLLFCVLMFAAINGCGNGGGDTAASGTTTGLKITVVPTPTSVAAGAISIIVAQVNNADDTAAPGVTVTFALPVNNSTANLKNLSGSATAPVTGITDVSGTAMAIYTAGGASPGLPIDDSVSASVTGATAAATITRLPESGTGNRIISFTEIPETLPAAPVSGLVIMKVKVTADNLTSPVVGVTVTFSILASGLGTLSSTSAITDTNGEAYVIFTRPATGSGETVVRAQIPGTINGGDAARIVYWTSAGSTTGITLLANPDLLNAGNLSTLTATVLDGSGNGVSGLTVTFNLIVNNSGGSFSSTVPLTTTTATTDASGEAIVIYYSGTTGGVSDSITATVSSGGNTYTAAENIQYW